MILTYIVNKNSYSTVKEVLISYFKISHRLLAKLKNKNAIFLNNIPCFVNEKIHNGDIINVNLNYNEESENIIPTKFKLDILKENDEYIIVNKPANMPVHPSCYHFSDTLSNAVKFYFDAIGLKKKIRPVNRIDTDTTGIVIFAKNEYIQENFIRQMKQNTFKKYYIAIVEGFLKNKKGSIIKPIARKQGSIMEREISNFGNTAITNYEVKKEIILNDKKISAILCELETGRTHQIRVHFSAIGHPLLGDDLYGGNKDLINRQALHSYKIEFINFNNNKEIITAPIPNDILNIIGNISL